MPTNEKIDLVLIFVEDMFVPSTLQIIRESELGSPPNKRRKKLQK